MTTPQMKFPLNDGTLPRTGTAPAQNRRIVLIGTSEKGPMFSAQSVKDPKEAELLFGSSTKGTLVKAAAEAYGAQIGSGKDANLVLIRIGAELAAKSNLEIVESGGTDVALTLEAINESAKFNDTLVTINANEFSIYNPELAVWSKFPIDFTSSPNEAMYNDMLELSQAINADPYASQAVQAVVTYKNARFELDLAKSDLDANNRIDLGDANLTEIATNLVYANESVVAAEALVGQLQSADDVLKRIHAWNNVYGITASDFIEVPANSLSVDIPSGIVHKTAHTGYKSLLNVTQRKEARSQGPITAIAAAPASAALYTPSAGDLSSSHTKLTMPDHGYVAGDKFTPGADAVSGTLAASFNSTELTVTHVLGDVVLVAIVWSDEEPGATPIYTASYALSDMAKTGPLDATPSVQGQAFETFDAEEVDSIVAGTNIITVTIDAPFGLAVDSDGSDVGFAAYSSAFATAASLTADPALADLTPVLPAGYTSAMQADVVLADGTEYSVTSLLDFSDWTAGVATLIIPKTGVTAATEISSVKLTGVSCAGLMTEATVGATLSGAANYRFVGNTLKLGAYASRRRYIRHLARIDYSGSDLVFVQAERYLEINGPGLGYNDGAISGNIIVGFDIDYIPANPATSLSSRLKGGSSGLGITENPMYFKREVAKALAEVENVEFSVVYIPKFYIDTVMTTWVPETGAEVIQNAGYADVMSDYLSSQYAGHSLGVMDISPIAGTGANGAITREDINSRFNKVAVPYVLDPLRVANTISLIEDLHLFVVDAEGQFAYNGSTYWSPLGAAAAGLASTMKSDEALYTKFIPNVRALRFRYTERTANNSQSQVNALSSARIQTGIVEAGGVRLSDAITLAGATSDYTLLSTFWMVEKMLGIAERIGRDYLGKSPNLLRIQTLRNALESAYDAMKPEELEAYDLKINVDAGVKAMKTIDIQLQVVPAGETRTFSVTTTLRGTVADIV